VRSATADTLIYFTFAFHFRSLLAIDLRSVRPDAELLVFAGAALIELLGRLGASPTDRGCVHSVRTRVRATATIQFSTSGSCDSIGSRAHEITGSSRPLVSYFRFGGSSWPESA
jgi:hypothetical protein